MGNYLISERVVGKLKDLATEKGTFEYKDIMNGVDDEIDKIHNKLITALSDLPIIYDNEHDETELRDRYLNAVNMIINN